MFDEQAFISAAGKCIADEVARALEPVKQELSKLTLKLEQAELRVRELRYAGVWSERGKYRKGNMVAHSGSLWHCNLDDIATVPGQDHDGWTLCVKSMARS